jgi:hypothetical protein
MSGTYPHMLVDSLYHCKRLRKATRQRNGDLSGGLKSNRVMRLIDPDGNRTWLKLSAYAAQLSREDWHQVNWPSAQGNRTFYAHLILTWVRKLGPTLVLITCHNLDDLFKSFAIGAARLLI